jgi:two-component system LytT family response regulator
MIRALIVDDELPARRSLRRFLDRKSGVEVVGECGDGETALAAIREKKPDLVFLDVQLPEMTGFEVIRKLGTTMPVTVFVTAYDRYALRAFDANAIDYLLKPFGKDRFERALERARQRIAGNVGVAEVRRLLATLEQMPGQRKYPERLSVSRNGRIFPVAVEEIDWIGAEGNYARLHAGELTYDVRETLTGLEEKLDPRYFLRIHRSTIVNVRRVREIRPWVRGHHVVVLKNGEELTMSRYQREVAKRLGL